MLLDDYFRDTYCVRRLTGKSPNTRRFYAITIRSFGKTLAKRPALLDLTDDNVCRHMQRVLDAGRSAATANKDRGHLLAMWRFAHRIGLVNVWPCVPQLTEPERSPVAWLPGEIDRLLSAVDQLPGHVERVPWSLWWRSLIVVCLDTGERISAIREAQWNWLSADWLTVPAESRKGKTRDRQYRLRPETMHALETLRGVVATSQVWPWPYSPTYLWRKYKVVLAAAGLPTTRRDGFHKIRRTLASIIHESGGSAQEALDHQYRRTTQRYLDPRFTRDRQPCDLLAEYLANPPRRGNDQEGRKRA